MSMVDHARVAEQVAAESPSKRCSTDARQGDITLRRVGDSKERGDGTPGGGLVLASGAHGEHRLLSFAVVKVGADLYDLADGGLVVHTDVPTARHATIKLDPGCWKVGRQRELGLDQSVVQVKD